MYKLLLICLIISSHEIALTQSIFEEFETKLYERCGDCNTVDFVKFIEIETEECDKKINKLIVTYESETLSEIEKSDNDITLSLVNDLSEFKVAVQLWKSNILNSSSSYSSFYKGGSQYPVAYHTMRLYLSIQLFNYISEFIKLRNQGMN